MAADYEMDFVRVGPDVTKIADAEPYIGMAKRLGMTVCAKRPEVVCDSAVTLRPGDPANGGVGSGCRLRRGLSGMQIGRAHV